MSGLAYQQGHGAESVPRRGEQHQAAITEQVVTSRERRKVGVVGGRWCNPVPAQPGQVNVPRHEAAQLGAKARQRVPLDLADGDVSLAEFPETADVVLMEVRQDRRMDVSDCVAESTQSSAQDLLWRDLEAGQSVVQHFGHSAGKIIGVRDRRSVLSGVEEHYAVSVLDDVGVDGPGPCPLAGGEQPPEHGTPGRRHVIGADLYVAGAYDGDPAYCVVGIHLLSAVRSLMT
jgi:hypothetical protein